MFPEWIFRVLEETLKVKTPHVCRSLYKMNGSTPKSFRQEESESKLKEFT